MDRQGFIDFNTRLSSENSRKASSYAQAIRILDEVLVHQNEIDLHGQSLYDVHDIAILEQVRVLVKEEVKNMKEGHPNIFDYGKPNQKSYPLKSFCSAALKSLKEYALYDQEVKAADAIVAQESNPRTISKKLITHFDLTKEGEDVVSVTKRRKGQDYFRRMILTNYCSRCALTGIDIPQLLIASHIIPWEDKKHRQDRLNPCNGICLSALYDKAFDEGLITFSPSDYTVCLSSALRENETKEYYDQHFGIIIGKKLSIPTEYLPNREFLEYHYDCLFQRYFLRDMAQKKCKGIEFVQMDISYYGRCYSKVKYYPAKEESVTFHSLREEDGFWFGLDLDDVIPINVHLFFSDRKWHTNCEYCERDADGGWNHIFDSAILCKNIRVKYTH